MDNVKATANSKQMRINPGHFVWVMARKILLTLDS
jgi:hypothetical protein